MNKEQYDQHVINFHSQLLLKILTKEARFTKKEIPDLMEEFIASFNDTVAAPFLNQLKNEVNSVQDLNKFPEQFLHSKDGIMTISKLAQKESNEITKDLFKLAVENSAMINMKEQIHPNVFTIQEKEMNKNINFAINKISNNFLEYDRWQKKIAPNFFRYTDNFIYEIFVIARPSADPLLRDIETTKQIKQIIPDFEAKILKQLPQHADYITRIFDSIERPIKQSFKRQ